MLLNAQYNLLMVSPKKGEDWGFVYLIIINVSFDIYLDISPSNTFQLPPPSEGGGPGWEAFYPKLIPLSVRVLITSMKTSAGVGSLLC